VVCRDALGGLRGDPRFPGADNAMIGSMEAHVRRTKPGERTDLECARSRMPMQRDRLRRSVILVGCSILGALNACVNMDAEPPESPPAPSPPPKPQFDAQVVTVDGEQFWEHRYLDRRIRVPLSDGRVSASEDNPSWYIPLPRDLPTRRPETGKSVEIGVTVTLRDARRSAPPDELVATLKNAGRPAPPPDAIRPEWGLSFYRSSLAPAGDEGFGYWTATDPPFTTLDGTPLVTVCVPYYSNDLGSFWHRLRCNFSVRISDQITMKVTFRGTFLPDWKRVYEAAISTIEQRVSPLDGEPAPNP
jgi:hypothetical protein